MKIKKDHLINLPKDKIDLSRKALKIPTVYFAIHKNTMMHYFCIPVSQSRLAGQTAMNSIAYTWLKHPTATVVVANDIKELFP